MPDAGATPLSREVEAFARDLLMLLRGMRMYPPGHPFLRGAVERLLAGVPWDARGDFAVGATRSELLVAGEFVGGTGSRAAELAGFLVGRGVGRLQLARGVEAGEVLELAGLLPGGGPVGVDLCRELKERGVVAVTVEPLHLERIHDAASQDVAGEAGTDENRRRQAWLWLQSVDVSPEELARVLSSDDPWAVGETKSDGGARAHALLLAGLGDRLEQALGFLPEKRRAAVLERVAAAGKSLTTSDLAELVAADDAGSRLRGAGSAALMGALDPERFVDLLANLAALGNRGSRRLAAVFRRFAPEGGSRRTLGLVRSRLLGVGRQAFALDVWKSVEEFLLRLEEDPFMAQDYTEILDAAGDEGPPVAGARGDDLAEDCGRHLDGVFVGLAADGGHAWRQRLLDRLAARLKEGKPFEAVRYANAVDEALPGILDERPVLVREVFRGGLAAAREARKSELDALLCFCRSHEPLLLGAALRALEQEQRIASRRLLVEMLSGLSPSATPTLVSRARSGPWFVARNLVIILARQGGARALPVLREFLEHRHPKVRREAQRALRPGRRPCGAEEEWPDETRRP